MPAITVIQIIIAVILIGLVLLQGRQSGGVGGIFGGGAGTDFYQKRRGFEKMIFVMTIISAAALAVFSILNLVKK